MPSRPADSGKPEGFIPNGALIVQIARMRPGISVKALCGAIWPSLPWMPAAPGADSAVMRLRDWPGCTTRKSAATWILDLIGDLRLAGVVRYGEPVPEVDRVAGITIIAVADVATGRIGHA